MLDSALAEEVLCLVPLRLLPRLLPRLLLRLLLHTYVEYGYWAKEKVFLEKDFIYVCTHIWDFVYVCTHTWIRLLIYECHFPTKEKVFLQKDFIYVRLLSKRESLSLYTSIRIRCWYEGDVGGEVRGEVFPFYSLTHTLFLQSRVRILPTLSRHGLPQCVYQMTQDHFFLSDSRPFFSFALWWSISLMRSLSSAPQSLSLSHPPLSPSLSLRTHTQ